MIRDKTESFTDGDIKRAKKNLMPVRERTALPAICGAEKAGERDRVRERK